MSILSEVVRSALEFPGLIADVAAQGPIQAVLVGFGALFIGVAALVFGLLAVAGVVELLIPERGPTHGPPAE